jgi:hypothetical protein
VRTVMYLAIGVGSLLYAARKTVELRHDPRDPARWFLIVAVTAGGSGFIVAVPPVYLTVDRVFEAPNIATLITYVSSIAVFCPALLATRLLWRFPPSRAWRMVRPILAVFAAVVAAQVVLFHLSSVNVSTPWKFDITYGPDPIVGSFLLVSYLPLAAVMAVAAVTTRRYAKVLGTTVGRRALRTVATGYLLLLGFPLAKVTYVILAWCGPRMVWLNHLGIASALAGGLLLIAGMSHTTWGPAAEKLAAAVRRWITYQQLYPLWKLITDRLPKLVLDPVPRPRLADLSPRHVRFRLLRRYTEIRDGLRILGPYLDEQDATAARHTASGITEDARRRELLVEAIRIRAALDRFKREQPAAEPVAFRTAEGDLATDTAWLAGIARSLRQATPLAPQHRPGPLARTGDGR